LRLEKETMKIRLLVKEKQLVIAVIQDECRKACEELKRQIYLYTLGANIACSIVTPGFSRAMP